MAGTCKGCGRKIIWGKTEDGRAIPLDAVAPVYTIQSPDQKGDDARVIRSAVSFVSHFVTCPNRDQFSKSKPAPKPAPDADEVW